MFATSRFRIVGPLVAATVLSGAAAAPLAGQDVAASGEDHAADEELTVLDTLPPDPDTVEPEGPEVRSAAHAAEAWLRRVDDGDFQEAWVSGASALQISASPQRLEAVIEDGRGHFEAPAARWLIGYRVVADPPGAARGRYVILRYRAHPTEGAPLLETITTKLEGQTWRVVGYDAGRD